MKTCDICGRDMKKGQMWVIFVVEKKGITTIFIRGFNLVVCTECNISYLSQYFGMSNKEVEQWLIWFLEDKK